MGKGAECNIMMAMTPGMEGTVHSCTCPSCYPPTVASTSCTSTSSSFLPSALEQEIWSQGLTAFDAGDYPVAIMHFQKLGLKSRAIYNIAICYLQQQNAIHAMACFERALRCDPYFCLANFQLAFLYQRANEHEQALRYYHEAIQSMRGNSMIDYSQLGLSAIIYACELHFNAALCQLERCDRGAAIRSLISAHQHRSLVRHDVVDQALLSAEIASIFRMRSKRQSTSISSLRLTTSLPEGGISLSGRSLVSVADGELDKSVQFMAPVHQERMRQELDRMERDSKQEAEENSNGGGNSSRKDPFSPPNPNVHHQRAASRSSSTALSISETIGMTTEDESGILSTIAKLHVIQGDDQETRLMSIAGVGALNFEQFLQRIKNKLKIDRLELKYLDQEGDLVVLCDDDDLRAALEDSGYESCARNPIYRLQIWCIVL